jgi:hypothetical protein
MAVELEIRDGNPWWLSPDIWVVPGTDPSGAPGTPVAGQTAFLWARVHNNGNSRVESATVRFYWANPAVGFDRTTATPIGSANVTLNGGQAEDVLCLTPWQVVWVNSGHECVLAEVFHAFDPLPPGPAFNVPTDRHVAQRNLSVVMAVKGFFQFAFEVHNPSRQTRVFRIGAEPGGIGQIEPLLPTLGKDITLPRPGKLAEVGLVEAVCPDRETAARAARERISLELPPGRRAGFSLTGLIEGGGALIHIWQQADEQITGGLSVLVLSAEGR